MYMESKPTQKGGLAAGRFAPHLQAHSSMRKCSWCELRGISSPDVSGWRAISGYCNLTVSYCPLPSFRYRMG
jgi:hypothetical protein